MIQETEIKITEMKMAPIDRTRNYHLYYCKGIALNGSSSDLEFTLATNQPIFLDNQKISFCCPSAFGSNFRVVKVDCKNGSRGYIDDIKEHFTRKYWKYMKTLGLD